MFEAFAVTVIEAARSFVQAMEILKVDWHTIQEIVRRAVERGLLRRSTEAVKQVGMDEKSFGRGQDYVSLMTALTGRRVLDVVEGRNQPVPLLHRRQIVRSLQRNFIVAQSLLKWVAQGVRRSWAADGVMPRLSTQSYLVTHAGRLTHRRHSKRQSKVVA